MSLDYTKFSVNGSEPESSDSSFDKRWWAGDEQGMANAITGVITFLAARQKDRERRNLSNARLYGNLTALGMNGLTFSSRMSLVNSPVTDRLSYNVVQSAIDTLTSKIAKNRPRPLFLTSGGNYKKQRRAKALNKFVDGVFYENDAHAKGPMTFRDGCVFDGGITHVFAHFSRVRFERVMPGELLIDEVEAFYGEPRSIHRVKNVDRSVLLELFPEKTSSIKMAALFDGKGGFDTLSDQVTVRDSIHLPSGPSAKDGFRVLSINNDVLSRDPWKHSFFPYARFSWNPRLYGYWGQSAVEQIQPIQLEINKLLWIAQRSFHLAGSFKVLIANGSKVVKEHFNNDIGALINYTGTKPEYVVPPVLPPEFLQHLWNLKNAAFEQVGVSQLSAAAKKPDGLNSGKALREYNDIETDRFMTVGQAYERYYLELAKLSIATAKDIYSEEKKYAVKVPGKRFIETIDWKDIDLEEDEYVMKVFPVSSLPNDPAGRLQTVQEYMQGGFISPRHGRRLLDTPDLEQEETLATAQEDYLHECLEKILEEGILSVLEPYDDLELARELGLQYYAQGKSNGVEEEKLDLIRQFIDNANSMTALAQQPAQAPTPQATAEPTPTSDLIPNVPAQGLA